MYKPHPTSTQRAEAAEAVSVAMSNMSSSTTAPNAADVDMSDLPDSLVEILVNEYEPADPASYVLCDKIVSISDYRQQQYANLLEIMSFCPWP
jgi:hypothetical protein